jgi:putative phosphoesterase
MRVGVIADTHVRVPAIAEFAKRFRAAGATMVLHAGDYCAPWALRPIIASGLTLAGVFGRNDGDLEGLRMEAARGMGIELFESPHSVEVAGVRILLVHDIGEVSERSIAEHGIVVHGFTHQHQMRSEGDSLVINPGEACGWVFGTPSAAILDLDTRRVEFITLPPAEWPR